MGKFIITEEEKRQILSRYGLLKEDDYDIQQAIANMANKLESEGKTKDVANEESFNFYKDQLSPEARVFTRKNIIRNSSVTINDTMMSDEEAEAQARKELNVPKQYAGGPSLDPEAYEKFQKENPQPSPQQNVSQGQNVNKYNYPRPYLNQNTSQQSTTNQGQNVVADLNKSLATIGGEGKGVSTTTNQPSSSPPNYNVNYKVLTPQKLTGIRTKINSTGTGNALTPEDLQSLYTTISKLPNKQ